MKFPRFILILAVAAGTPLLAPAVEVDGIMAVVADKVITYQQVAEYTAPAIEALNRQYLAQPEVFREKSQTVMRDGLEQLIERALILHTYESGGYNPLPDSFVDSLVQDKIRDNFGGDRVTMIKTLQAQGITVEEYRKQLLDGYIERGLRAQNVQKAIIISPSKIESYYQAHPDEFKVEDQVKLHMMVLTKPSPDDTNTLALAREIAGKIKAGVPFAEMTAVYSQSSPQHPGGDWGWVERSVLRKELADAAFTLAPGQVADPVDTPDSVYIIQLDEKKPAYVRALADVRDAIEKTLLLQEQARLSKEWIDSLKKKTYLVRFGF
ncbi:MAG TPA: peptidyl-prolyl cis-trans isomerase [Verrucomicrobiae bacterium]